jgi:hypothetical protein
MFQTFPYRAPAETPYSATPKASLCPAFSAPSATKSTADSAKKSGAIILPDLLPAEETNANLSTIIHPHRGLSSRVKPCAKTRTASRLWGLTRSAIPVLWLPCLRRRSLPLKSRSPPPPKTFRFAPLNNQSPQSSSTPRPAGLSPVESVMHVASNSHDLQSLPRLQNSCALPPIFALRDIQTIGAFVPQPTDMVYSRYGPKEADQDA